MSLDELNGLCYLISTVSQPLQLSWKNYFIAILTLSSHFFRIQDQEGISLILIISVVYRLKLDDFLHIEFLNIKTEFSVICTIDLFKRFPLFNVLSSLDILLDMTSENFRRSSSVFFSSIVFVRLDNGISISLFYFISYFLQSPCNSTLQLPYKMLNSRDLSLFRYGILLNCSY